MVFWVLKVCEFTWNDSNKELKKRGKQEEGIASYCTVGENKIGSLKNKINIFRPIL